MVAEQTAVLITPTENEQKRIEPLPAGWMVVKVFPRSLEAMREGEERPPEPEGQGEELPY